MRFSRPTNCPACHGRMRVSKYIFTLGKRKYWMAQLVCKNCNSGIQWTLAIKCHANSKKTFHSDVDEMIRAWNRMFCNRDLDAQAFYVVRINVVRIIGNNLMKTDSGYIRPKKGCE